MNPDPMNCAFCMDNDPNCSCCDGNLDSNCDCTIQQLEVARQAQAPIYGPPGPRPHLPPTTIPASPSSFTLAIPTLMDYRMRMVGGMSM